MSALAQMIAAFGEAFAATNYVAYFAPGTYSFTVPEGVTSLGSFALAAGGGSSDIKAGGGYGAGGGAVAYSNGIAVTPGEVLTIVVGAGGIRGTWPGGASPGVGPAGGDSALKRGGSDLVMAAGGQGAGGSAGAGGLASSCVGDTCLSGGNGGNPSVSMLRGGQGGGSATWILNGANGVTSTTNYRGGGRGNGLSISDGNMDWTLSATNAASYNGEGIGGYDKNYKGFGAGGGAFGDVGLTLAGIGANGAPGSVAIIWGGREFTGSDFF
jgi:hypothetical protein